MDPKEKELAYQYAWDWFRYHAQQRMTAFYYFLLIIGALSYGYIQAMCRNNSEKQPIIAASVGVLGIIVSLAFLILERRNRELVDDGREALDKLEDEQAPFSKYSIRKLDIQRDEKWGICGKILTHTFAIRLLIFAALISSIVAIYYACNMMLTLRYLLLIPCFVFIVFIFLSFYLLLFISPTRKQKLFQNEK